MEQRKQIAINIFGENGFFGCCNYPFNTLKDRTEFERKISFLMFDEKVTKIEITKWAK